MAGNFSVATAFVGRDRMSPVFGKMGKSASLFGSILKANIAGAALRKGFDMLKTGMISFIGEARKIEDATAAFTPLMGSAQKATQLVDALNKTAATTPFQFDNISSAAKQLLPVMNQDIEKTIATFRMLGDTAGGNAQKLDSITRGFTKAMLKGKVDMESLNMIAEAGVPIYSELANSMGVSVQEMMQLSRVGKISSDDLTNAFKAMTSEGGIFFKGMEIASLTLSGLMSTLSDNIKLTKAAIGTALLPIIKPLISDFIELASRIREFVGVNQILISQKIGRFFEILKSSFNAVMRLSGSIIELGKAVWSVVQVIFKGLIPSGERAGSMFQRLIGFIDFTVKVLTVFVNAIRPIIALLKPFIIVIGGIVLAIKAWITVQAIINFLMTANPIGLVIVGIAALIVGIIALVQNWDKVVGAMKRVWNWFLKMLDNPIFTAVATLLAPWLTIPAMIIKHWEPIKAFFTDLWINNIKPIFEAIKLISGKIGGFFGGAAEKIGGFFGGEESEAPNRREAEARQQIAFQGRLDIAGAPEGSQLQTTTTGAPPIRAHMLGAAQ